MFSCRKAIQNEQGIALIVVLLVLTVLSVLSLGLLGLSLNNTKMTNFEQKYEAAYYIAEAGAADALIKVKKAEERVKSANLSCQKDEPRDRCLIRYLKSEINGIDTYELTGFEDAYGNTTASVSIIEDSEEYAVDKYTVTSTGIIENEEIAESNARKVERTVIQSFTLGANAEDSGGGVDGTNEGWPNIPGNSAVYTKSTLDLSGTTIIGDAGTSAESITVDWSTSISGALYVPSGTNTNTVLQKPKNYNKTFTVLAEGAPVELKLPSFPDFDDLSESFTEAPNDQVVSGTRKYNVIENGSLKTGSDLANGYMLNLTSNVSFEEIEITSNRTVNINVGSANRAIMVDHLNIEQGHINIIGSGTLTIYVREEIDMGNGSSTINANTGNPKKLVIYVDEGTPPQTVKIGGNSNSFGSLYAKNANINISGSGGFHGNILTGGISVNISGGSGVYSSLIYAPLANVNLSGSGQVKGTVISDTFKGQGNVKVTNEKIDFSTVPFRFQVSSPSIPEEDNSLITEDPVLESY